LREGGIGAKELHSFLSNENIFSENENYLILDNASIHHSDRACKKIGLSSIRELLASKNIKPLYLPPYTPEMNPVEHCFNIIKGEVRKYQPKTYEELEATIEKVLNDIIHQKDMTEFFQHCYYYSPPEKGVSWIKA